MTDDALLQALLATDRLDAGERRAFERMLKGLKRRGALTQRQLESAQHRAAELQVAIDDPEFGWQRPRRSKRKMDPVTAGARRKTSTGNRKCLGGSGLTTPEKQPSGPSLRDLVRASRGKGGLTDAEVGRLFGITADRVRALCKPTLEEAQVEARRTVRGAR